MTDTRLPVIHTLRAPRQGGGGAGEDGRDPRGMSAIKKAVKKQASHFLSGLQLGHLQPLPRPGDTYYPASPRQRRPLGLIPGRNDRLDALKKLNQLLSPWTVSQTGQVPPLFPPGPSEPPLTTPAWPTEPLPESEEAAALAISATVRPVKTSTALCIPKTSVDPTSYRLSSKGLSDSAAVAMHADPDYMGDRARQYYALLDSHPAPQPPATASNSQDTTFPDLALHNSLLAAQKPQKQARLKGYDHVPVSTRQYLNFTGQMRLFQRTFTDDRREALEYEPCERCRLRGGRCARCKAIRTGGGYIILDAGEEWDKTGRRWKGYDFWSGGALGRDKGRERERGKRRGLEGEGGGERYGGEDSAADMSGEGGLRHLSGGRRGDGGWGDDGGRGRGGGPGVPEGSGRRDGDGRGWNDGTGDMDKRTGFQRMTSAKDSGWAGEESNGSDYARAHQTSSHGEAGEGSGDGYSDGDHMNSEKQGHASRSGSRVGRSRPGSKMGSRPGSSLRQGGHGVERGRKGLPVTTEEEGGGRGRRRKPHGEEESDEEDEGRGERKRGRTARKRKESAGDGREVRGDYKFSGARREGEEEEDQHGYHGNLRKFKRKRDDVKALHATMKELQGIDPLDYLARYCIIDQSKVPHYQHVYNNVDRDEDDEIDIGELDFALKAVNYDLISDSEMNYVHSVLELAGRYKLNFRLFSLIAALSEKVVALEDMVKRLINKMDFDALEVKMKKCKELFYLLADADAASEHEGGVVTTGSLAVELQAGGLTQEHVEFVVDRLNHEGKGLVEFLDYLTYVPLFVEIHDSISGNPLDFTRTK